MTALFEHPTISAFSRHIDELVAKTSAIVPPPIEKVSRDQPLPLSFAQERSWRNERNGATFDNVNVLARILKVSLAFPLWNGVSGTNASSRDFSDDISC